LYWHRPNNDAALQSVTSFAAFGQTVPRQQVHPSDEHSPLLSSTSMLQTEAALSMQVHGAGVVVVVAVVDVVVISQYAPLECLLVPAMHSHVPAIAPVAPVSSMVASHVGCWEGQVVYWCASVT
jgi:hypothetical protein